MENLPNFEGVDLKVEIKKRIDDQKLSVRQVAKAIGLSPSGLQRMVDKGGFDVEVVGKLSGILGFNFFELFVVKPDVDWLKDALAKIAELESKLAEQGRKVERLESENAIYKETMAVLKKRI